MRVAFGGLPSSTSQALDVAFTRQRMRPKEVLSELARDWFGCLQLSIRGSSRHFQLRPSASSPKLTIDPRPHWLLDREMEQDGRSNRD